MDPNTVVQNIIDERLTLFPRGAFHSQKISYTLGKNPFVFNKNPPKIRENPFVMKESRTLFRKSEMPLVFPHSIRRLEARLSKTGSKPI